MINEDQAAEYLALWLYWGVKGAGMLLIGISPFIAAAFVSVRVDSWLDDPCRRERFHRSKDFLAGVSFLVTLGAAFAAFPLAGLVIRYLKHHH